MTKTIICSKGKCEYPEEEFQINADCVDCTMAEQIEHDLFMKELS